MFLMFSPAPTGGWLPTLACGNLGPRATGGNCCQGDRSKSPGMAGDLATLGQTRSLGESDVQHVDGDQGTTSGAEMNDLR